VSIAWSLATLCISHEPLLQSISSAARSRITEFSASDVCTTLWSYATLGYTDFPLRTAISAAALSLITEFSSQNLERTAWAL